MRSADSFTCAERPEAPRQSFATVRRCGLPIAVPLAYVTEAVLIKPATLGPSPRRNSPIVGLLSFRDASLPVIAIERWIPMKLNATEVPSELTVLVLSCEGNSIGIVIDVLEAVVSARPSDRQQIHQAEEEEELFDAVLQSGNTAWHLLEMPRLMRLAAVWSDGQLASDASLLKRRHDVTGDGFGLRVRLKTLQMHLDSAFIAQVLPMPPLASRWRSQAGCSGVVSWRGRKVAVLDLASLHGPTPQEPAWPWVVIVRDAAERHLALPVDELIGLGGFQLDDALLAEVSGYLSAPGLDDQGQVCRSLRVSVLLEERPEALLGAEQNSDESHVAARNAEPFMVLDVGMTIAAPVSDVHAIQAVEVPPDQAAPELIQWRGRTLRVDVLPGGKGPFGFIAVVGDSSSPSAIAVKQVRSLVPARSALLRRFHGAGGSELLFVPEPSASVRIMRFKAPI